MLARLGTRQGGPLRVTPPRRRTRRVGLILLGLLALPAQAEPLAIHYLERRIERPTPSTTKTRSPTTRG